jgi:hypothetical protein
MRRMLRLQTRRILRLTCALRSLAQCHQFSRRWFVMCSCSSGMWSEVLYPVNIAGSIELANPLTLLLLQLCLGRHGDESENVTLSLRAAALRGTRRRKDSQAEAQSR